MAKKIKFIVKDRTTIELDENANKGDIIDLADANQVDENQLKEAIEKAAWDKAEEIAEKETSKIQKEYEVEKAKLQAQIKSLREQKDIEVKNVILEEKQRLEKETSEKIAKLEKDLALAKESKDAAIKLAVSEAEKKSAERIQKLELINVEKDAKLKETEDQWMRRHFSTKSYGEELEKIVYEDFISIQQAGAFPNAKFYKDNEVISSGEGLKGTKGDFIFKDYDDIGNEILSIEIEVKTEQKTNSTSKTHNRDHYKKLDDDRRKKECEYAVLVSELEKDNRIFDGIYKVPGFDKMYVVRPQSLIALISMLKDSLNKNKELIIKLNQRDAKIKNKQLFIKNLAQFKQQFDISKDRWEKHLDGVEKSIKDAINELEDTLEHIQQSRKALISGEKKVEKLTVKKLLKGCTSEDDVFDTEDENTNE